MTDLVRTMKFILIYSGQRKQKPWRKVWNHPLLFRTNKEMWACKVLKLVKLSLIQWFINLSKIHWFKINDKMTTQLFYINLFFQKLLENIMESRPIWEKTMSKYREFPSFAMINASILWGIHLKKISGFFGLMTATHFACNLSILVLTSSVLNFFLQFFFSNIPYIIDMIDVWLHARPLNLSEK